MSLQNLQNVMKDRYDWENNRNKDLESKAYRLLFLSTFLIPLSKYLELDNEAMIIPIILAIIMAVLFFLVIKLRPFKHPLDPNQYFDKCGNIKENMIVTDLKLTEKELVDHRVRAYLDCSYHNKTIAKKKIRYLQYMSANILIQMGVIFPLFIFPTLQKISF